MCKGDWKVYYQGKRYVAVSDVACINTKFSIILVRAEIQETFLKNVWDERSEGGKRKSQSCLNEFKLNDDLTENKKQKEQMKVRVKERAEKRKEKYRGQLLGQKAPQEGRHAKSKILYKRGMDEEINCCMTFQILVLKQNQEMTEERQAERRLEQNLNPPSGGLAVLSF